MSQSDFATGTLYQGLGSIFFFGVYLFDSLIFINRYLAVYPRTSTCKKIGLYIYLSLQFVLWVPAFLFGPFIVDMSTPKANELMALLLVISSVLKTIFNATFSVVFFRMLLTYFRSPVDYRKRSYNYTVYLISLKSVIHFVTSVIAVALSAIFESNVRIYAAQLTVSRIYL